MNAAVANLTPEEIALPSLSKGRVGMACLIIAESAIFTIFVVAYIFYLGKSLNGPTPRQVLELPIVNTICLLGGSQPLRWEPTFFSARDTSGND